MSEHVHEWGFPELAPADIKNFAWCEIAGCIATLTIEEVVCRLNATERLSAEDARETADDVHGDWWPLEGTSPYEDALRAYAAALEGDDDLSKLPTQQKLTAEDMESA